MTMDTNLHAFTSQEVSEADFLARVAAFERHEEAEARRAKEAMRRMVLDQSSRSNGHCERTNGPKRDRSPSTGPTGISRRGNV